MTRTQHYHTDMFEVHLWTDKASICFGVQDPPDSGKCEYSACYYMSLEDGRKLKDLFTHMFRHLDIKKVVPKEGDNDV